MESEKIIFDRVVDRIKQRFPGIGDESGELDHETVVIAVLAYTNQEAKTYDKEEAGRLGQDENQSTDKAGND